MGVRGKNHQASIVGVKLHSGVYYTCTSHYHSPSPEAILFSHFEENMLKMKNIISKHISDSPLHIHSLIIGLVAAAGWFLFVVNENNDWVSITLVCLCAVCFYKLLLFFWHASGWSEKCEKSGSYLWPGQMPRQVLSRLWRSFFSSRIKDRTICFEFSKREIKLTVSKTSSHSHTLWFHNIRYFSNWWKIHTHKQNHKRWTKQADLLPCSVYIWLTQLLKEDCCLLPDFHQGKGKNK